MEKSATEIYKQLAERKGALIPSDQTLASAWGMTNGATTGARRRLREEGYEFEQRDDGYWEVTKMPGDMPIVTHYHATEDGIYKVHHEKVDRLPDHLQFGRGQSKDRWDNLIALLDSMQIGDIERVHFTSYLVATRAQSALHSYCRKERKPFTVNTVFDPAIKDAPEYWMYFRKVAKDVQDWGKYEGIKRNRGKKQ